MQPLHSQMTAVKWRAFTVIKALPFERVSRIRHHQPLYFCRILFVLLSLYSGMAGADTAAERLIAAGHWKRARALVEADQRAHPENALNYYLLSQIRHAFGDDEAPVKLAERAVELEPRVGKYHRQLAEVLGIAAQHANPVKLVLLARRFRKELDLAMEFDPKDPLAVRDLLEYYFRAPRIAGGDPGKAAALVEKIAALDVEEGWLARVRLLRDGKPAQYAAALESAARAVPGSYLIRMRATEAALRAVPPDLDRAERHARAAAGIDAGRAAAYGVLAQVAALRQRWDELDKVLAAAEAAVPDDLVPCFRAAEVLVESGANSALARRLLEKYLAHEPEGGTPTREDARKLLGRIKG